MKTNVLSFWAFMVLLMVIFALSCSKYEEVADTESTIENVVKINEIGPIENVIEAKETVETYEPIRVYKDSEWIKFARAIEIIQTNIDYVEETEPALLLKTKTGCPKTRFEIKHGFFHENTKLRAVGLAARTINELNILRENYLDLPYLDEFAEGFFENNILFFVITYDDDWVVEAGRWGNKYEVHVTGVPVYEDTCIARYGLFVLRLPKA
jgi:hypothetical protein